MISFDKLTRVDVVDENGLALTRIGYYVQAFVQDEGKTLKLFLRPHPEAHAEYMENLRESLRGIK